MVEQLAIREAIGRLVAAWNANDALRASAFFAEEAHYAEFGHEPIVGRAAIATHFTRFFRDGPPWRLSVEEIIIEGERAAVTYRFSLRSEAGQWIDRDGCAIVRFAGAQVLLWREYQG